MNDPEPNARVLVADDEEQICHLVRDVLGAAGYAIDFTRDGLEILPRYATGEYDLLILDSSLMHTSGLEVVMRLRDKGDRTPIILMSGPSRENERIEPFAFAYGVDVLRKPFGVRDLRSSVARAVKPSVS